MNTSTPGLSVVRKNRQYRVVHAASGRPVSGWEGTTRALAQRFATLLFGVEDWTLPDSELQLRGSPYLVGQIYVRRRMAEGALSLDSLWEGDRTRFLRLHPDYQPPSA